MADLRALSNGSALARARRLLGRVLGSVGLTDPRSATADASADASADATPRPAPAVAPTPRSPSAAAARLLADPSWSGLRVATEGDDEHVAWRAIEGANVLRTVEVRCALGALDASPEVTVHDRPLDASEGAVRLASDALRLVVALGTLEAGRFVSLAHANVR